jgi:GNAT superfamily N-acetyltransferase
MVRPMKDSDLDDADRIMRLAFGTFLGLPDPMKFMGDADYVKTRFIADPSAALVAEVDGSIVGSNFALDWGSVGIFGPLTIDPKFWDKGVARSLLEGTMEIFEKWGTKHMGLYTFAQSTKHVHLYQKFGFWPRYLTAVMSKRVEPKAEMKRNIGTERYSSLNSSDKKEAIDNCARLTGRIFDGLDLRKEILSVDNQKLGDTILIKDAKNSMDLAGFAICHSGPDTEAGSGNCYVKFAAISPGHETAANFVKLLDECEQYTRASNATRLVAGANTGRHEAYVAMMEQGFRTDMQGVAMHKPDEPGYNLPDVYLIDDWR